MSKMDPSDRRNGSKTLDDALYRRLKDRERQRRYRERKRLRADARNVDVTNQPSEMQIVPLITNGNVEQVVTRVHCRRDWKKDARRAHTAEPEAFSNSFASSVQSLTSENHMPNAAAGTLETDHTMNGGVLSQTYPCRSDSEKTRTKRGRRDWKAEARNKN